MQVSIRPGLSPDELMKLEEAREYLEWQLKMVSDTISWAKRGYAGLPLGEPTGGKTSAIRDLVQQVLADHRPHAREEIIRIARERLGEGVRIPAVLSALRSRKIKKQGDNYILLDGEEGRVRRRA